MLVGSMCGVAPLVKREAFSPLLLVATLAIAMLLSGLASWLPALLASKEDPAVALREG